jgi:hypothetical protein
MNMNQRIRHYIKSNGMTFTFVAERAGIDIKKFSRFMNDKQVMTMDEYETICREGLRLDPAYFFDKKFLESRNKSA